MMQKVLSESPSNIETAMISATSLARGKAIRGELFCRPAMQVLAHLYEGDTNPDSSGWTQKLEALGALSCIPMNTLEVKKVGGQLGFVPQELKIAEVYLRAFGVREGGRE